jgi:Domain of unknown function (DUF4281)
MTLDSPFQLANGAAVLGWLLLLAGLLAQGRSLAGPKTAAGVRASLWLGGRAIPVLLSLGYAAAIAFWWRGAPGDFSSLQGVATLFGTRGLLLAGWVHYLAFDLWLGRWQIDALQSASTAARPLHWSLRWLVVPCLLLTFLFGPIGLLMFLVLMRVYKLAPLGSAQTGVDQ